MGGGYSGNYTGTAGAIGDKQLNQLSFVDELPVRKKSAAEMGGGTGGENDFVPTITAEMILGICESYRSGDITSEQLVTQLEQLLTLPKNRFKKTLHGIVKHHVPLLRAACVASFGESLLVFENALRYKV